MSLEQQLADAIVSAFDHLGGEPLEAVRQALYQRTVGDWVRQETTTTALIGGAEMAIPGLHALTIPAGITFLLHKMATITWGIGALRRAAIVETAQLSDLRNVLTIWGNNGYYDASQLSHRAISLPALSYVLSAEGYQQLLARSYADESDERTRRVALHLAYHFVGDERMQALYRHQLGNKALAEALSVGERPEPPLPEDNDLTRRIGARLALRLAAQLSARVPARLLMGFVPLIGPLFNAIANAGTLQSMADCADKYYYEAVRPEDWQNLNGPEHVHHS
ncbi:MAG: hypothetical protein NZ750_13990 [Anaerolineae bacterium]|nr:hypothetical protein [Anaerolineae bacterium]MDW8171323.1 hypothetical protein [Anaerolineae bacterium]